jgi:hypothetical protein
VREGADAGCESGCEGGAGWGEVVEDYLGVLRSRSVGYLLPDDIDQIDGCSYVCAFSCEFPCYGSTYTSS